MIITALDFPSLKEATAFVDRIDPSLTRLKVGKELFTASGPGFVEGLAKRGFDVFLDLKFHDIPNTVAGGVRSAASLGVWMLTVHASGGPSMLSAARDACPKFVGNAGTRIVAVTVLTSLDDAELKRVGVDADMQTQVKRLTDLTHECQLDGVVCSPLEAAATRQQTDADFLIVTPGVRPAMATSDDQRRVMTPVDAKAAGSSYLVMGRPIIQADDPVATLKSINNSLQESASA